MNEWCSGVFKIDDEDDAENADDLEEAGEEEENVSCTHMHRLLCYQSTMLRKGITFHENIYIFNPEKQYKWWNSPEVKEEKKLKQNSSWQTSWSELFSIEIFSLISMEICKSSNFETNIWKDPLFIHTNLEIATFQVIFAISFYNLPVDWRRRARTNRWRRGRYRRTIYRIWFRWKRSKKILN